MSVSIRLAKVGKRNAPAFKIVAATTRSKRNGIYLDILGFYNPSKKPVEHELNEEKYTEWVKKGAIVTQAVQDLRAGTYTFKPYIPKKAKTGEAGENDVPAESSEPTKAE